MLGIEPWLWPHSPHRGRIAAAVFTSGLAIITIAVLAQRAIAGCDGQGRQGTRPCNSGLMLGCPDDYCRKPLPCAPCPQTGCCPDDYCRKPLPCVPCPQACCGPDDYCRKPLPSLCRPPLPVKYSCGPCPTR